MDANNNGDLARQLSTALAKRQEPLEMRVTPVADIYETADAFTIKLDMPGALNDSVKVRIEPGHLWASGNSAQFYQDDARLVFGEIGRRSYFREFNLGRGVNHDDVQAQYEDGVLTITVPKTDEIKPREIQIK
jgi:HSP20 family protein